MPLVFLTTLKWVDFEGFFQIASSPETNSKFARANRPKLPQQETKHIPRIQFQVLLLFEGRVSREMIEFEGVYSSHPRRKHIFGWFSVMSFDDAFHIVGSEDATLLIFLINLFSVWVLLSLHQSPNHPAEY